MRVLKRIWRFITVYLSAHPRFFFGYLIRYYDPVFLPRVTFLPPEALTAIIASGKSFIRFGDGEIYLLNGGTMGYEASSEFIRTGYKRIIAEYTSAAPYVVGINQGPMTTTNVGLRRLGLLHCWLPLKVYYELYFPKSMSYLDASIFYFNETFPRYVEPALGDKSIIIVTRQATIKAQQTNARLPFKEAVYIETPDTQTSLVYDSVKAAIVAAAEATYKPPIVLLACGPASKLLAYDLALLGIQAIDIGIGVELMYTDTDKSGMVLPPSPYRLTPLASGQ